MGVLWYFHGLPDTLPAEEFAIGTGVGSVAAAIAEVDAEGD